MKKIKSEGAVKSKTPYKMKFIKKVATIASAVVLSAALFLGAAFTLTGCNNEKDPIDPNPPIVDPIPDPEPDPDPDPEPEPEPEPDPDPDPDPNPDPDPEPEPEPDPMPEYDEIDTIEELYGTEAPVLEEFTEEKYGSNYKEFYNNEVREYNEAQEMQEAIYKNLEANVKEKMVKRAVGNDYVLTNANIIKWELESSQNNNIIDTVRAFIDYDAGNNNVGYYIESVVPKTEVTIQNLASENGVDYDTAFSTSARGGAKYTNECNFTYNTEKQTELKDLLNAINTKIGSQIEGDIQSFIKVNGGWTDVELGGTANRYTILNVSENGYEEYSINILDSSNGKSEIENLNNNGYRTYDEKSATYGKQFLDENSGKEHMDEIQIDNKQTKKAVKYVAKVSLPKEDGTVEEYEIEL